MFVRNALCYNPLLFSTSGTQQYTTRSACITCVSVQMCDVNPEQPIDFFQEKKNQTFYSTKEICGLFGINVADS